MAESRSDQAEAVSKLSIHSLVAQLEHHAHRLGRAFAGGADADAVHEARKALKKLRSGIRLLASILPEAVLDAEADLLHGWADALAGVRDADSRILVFDSLQGLPGLLDPASCAALRSQLIASREHAVPASTWFAGSGREAEALRQRIGGWRPDHAQGRVRGRLEDALAHACRRAAAAHLRAVVRPSARRLHRWRRRIKDLGNQAQLLASAGGCASRPPPAGLDALAERLGDLHDAHLLNVFLDRSCSSPGHRLAASLARRLAISGRDEALTLGASVHGDGLWAIGVAARC